LILGVWCIRFIATAALAFRQTPLTLSHIDPAKGATILGLVCVGSVTAFMLTFVCLSASLDRKLSSHAKKLALAKQRKNARLERERTQAEELLTVGMSRAVCVSADGNACGDDLRLGTELAREQENGPVRCAPSVLAGVKALIVDANRTNRRILEDALTSWGMIPIFASSGEQALALHSIASRNGQSFGLVITDLHMPKMDGFQLVERFKERQDFSASAIVMSAFPQRRADVQRCDELGVAAYLVKPVTQAELRKIVVRLLSEGDSKRRSSTITRTSPRETSPMHRALTILLAHR
jgi:CheY-like chemotaxis protein